MVEPAIHIVPARKAPRTSETDRWFGRGRALAGEIWGANYVGTIPSYGVAVTSPANVLPEGVPPAGSLYVTVGAGTTPRVFSPTTLEELYWQAFRPTSEIGPAFWEGDCLISLPAQIAPPAPDLVFWTSEGVGASSVLIVAEANLSRTDPADAAHAPAWRQVLGHQSTLQRPPTERRPAFNRDVYTELRMLLEWTRLPVEQLGELLGASRRTTYNWLAGRPIRDAAKSRIFRLRDAIAEIAASRDPVLVRAWLLQGKPSPVTLALNERWTELEARVRDETSPLRPSDAMPEREGEQPRAESRDVLKATLLAFSTAPSRTVTRRPEWRPREITGIEGEDQEDAE